MDAFFLNLVNMSITASWLVLAVILLRLLLNKAPKAFAVALWAIVALRLIFPFSIESVLSLVPSAETIPQDIVFAREPVIDSGVQSINNVVNPIITETFAPTTELTSINPIQVFLSFAELFWIVGMIAMALYALISYLRIAYRVREAAIIRNNIYVCDNVPSPFILGIFRPRIILPSDMDESDKEYVIAHEKAHLRRRDHFWKPLGFLLLTVYWFNPILWVAYILLCRDIELACDERVIRDMGVDDKKAYSSALLNCSMPRHMISACPLAFGEVGVKQRIKSVLNYKKPAFWLIVAALIITVAVAIGFLTDPKTEEYKELDSITAHAYEVEQVVYTAPYLSFMYFPGHNTPFYTITETYDLLRKEIHVTSNDWENIGKLEKVELSKYNFDVFVEEFHDLSWRNELSAKKLRDENANAWALVGDSLFFLLQQKDGSVYAAFGTTTIHHVFKLVTNIHEDTGLIAISGENTVPVKILSTDDSLEKIKNQVNWLDITYSENAATPFDIYCDGNKQIGLYSIYDAKTFEKLEFFKPYGIAPHTYIFENAVDGGEYIITMQWEYGIEQGDTALLCFGARLPGEPITGVWEIDTGVLGVDADGVPENPVTTYVFNADKTGYFIAPLANAENFTYTCLNGLLTLTYDIETASLFSYECDGRTLTLTDLDSTRTMVLHKAVYTELEVPPIEEQPSGISSMVFFRAQDIIGKKTEISSLAFSFKKDVNHSMSTGLHTDYIDNLVLSNTNGESYVLSFSIYQDALPYVNSLFSLLNSIVNVDYEGMVLYDARLNPNEYVKINMNGMPGTITEVSLGAGNGHRDFYFTFHTEEYIEFKDITEFDFSVNQAPINFDVEIVKESNSAILSSGAFEVHPTRATDYGDYTEFILKIGDRYKMFTGYCLGEDHWRREMYIDDLTGDGVNDITIVFQTSHGTGVAAEDIHVFDGVTLEEYAVEPLYDTIGEHINFSADEDFCYLQITDAVYRFDKQSLYPDYEKKDWFDTPATNNVYSFSVADGLLAIKMPCQYTNTLKAIGYITAYYEFKNSEFVYKSAIYEE